jgi:predicted nucleic acid-binding protein
MPRSLVDTNILIYANDRNETIKRSRAIALIDQLSASGELVMSAQCLNEFSSVALRRGVPISEVRTTVGMLRDLGQVLPLTDVMTLAALEVVERHTLSFWDALIWAAAKTADLPVVIHASHCRTPDATIAFVRNRWQQGDDEICRALTAAGLLTGKRRPFTAKKVHWLLCMANCKSLSISWISSAC